MHGTLWIGCYPGLTTEMLDYVIASIRAFVRDGARA
jgi:dTDP-4-amino-4,6-dideoxygalactose transaminase